MEHVDKNALNLEMLRIAGFTCTGGIWTYPDGVDVDNGVPFFPESFDECLKWIAPAVNITDIHFMLDTGGASQLPSCTISTFGVRCVGYHEDIKVAFCLAVRELK